ncbi:RING finger protein 141-like protein [Cucumis melo var. makuwa]|uniref:RING-type E3 ubiquitin transferase n=2 Tax=Cucumis melo TaxID=3656 RepID=A0A1S4E0Q9_CUCME|nr:uncharacterized protein LOC103495859 [Cucumis melo]KAA0025781.1 RING finger protein 141-like [Cucumis melo var. makuwa]TYK09674.1 RING finger protein 141-like protein [Cucumis melo var. makuwa]
MEYQISQYSTTAVEIDIDLPMSRRIRKHPSPIELIGLLFTLRRRCNRFQVLENGERQLVEEQEASKVPLCDHQFPVEIFNGDDNSLFQYLCCSFENYEPKIDAEVVATALIEQWIGIRDQLNSRSCHKVFSMTVNLTITDVVVQYVIGEDGSSFGGEDFRAVPACDKALKKMLKRLEVRDEDERICIICLDEVRKKKNGRCGLEMPCLHVFHGKCIENWLKNSHCCPICRFQMPISSGFGEDF